MHSLLRGPYAALGAVAEFATVVAPDGVAKWQRAVRARRGLAARYGAFAPLRDSQRPLVWFHASSVGESLQALPVMQRMRARRFDGQIAFTWFSPSAAPFAERFPADFRDYLGFDTAGAAGRELDALRPTALVYAKLDVWPTLTERAVARGVRTALISATLGATSGRRSGLATALLRDAYAALDLVGAVSDDDAQRLVALGVSATAIRVTGDTRFDQVWERVRGDADPRRTFAPTEDRPTLVAGSTWPADVRVLTAAWEVVRARVPRARLVIVPHEPTARHLDPIRSWAVGQGMSVAGLEDALVWQADLVLVDRVGILAELYSMADVAYVGGGFHRAGLHSVLEPAALGVPVLFGPGGSASTDAVGLTRAGGGREVADSLELAAASIEWILHPEEGPKIGQFAEAFVRRNLGASDRCLSLVCDLIGRAGFPAQGWPTKA